MREMKAITFSLGKEEKVYDIQRGHMVTVHCSQSKATIFRTQALTNEATIIPNKYP